MPNSVSAVKRDRQNAKRRQMNKAKKSRIATETKKFHQAIEGGDLDQAQAQFQLVTKLLDKAAKSNVFHDNKVARKKSQLARELNAKKS